MSKKIIFFDIDGTIYDRIKGVPENTKIAIKKLVENGHIPVICTGRAKSMGVKKFMDLGFLGAVCGCGTYIEYNNKVIKDIELPQSLVNEIVPVLKQKKFFSLLEGTNKLYYDEEDIQEDYKELFKLIYNENKDYMDYIKGNKDIHIAKLTCRFTNDSLVNEACEYMKQKGFYDIHHIKGSFAIEFVPKGYSKASGIEELINYLGIDRNDTYAFGDSPNDTEMLKYVKYGVAMGNSNEEMFEIAPYRTTGMFEDGIYISLQKFGLI